jgi:hypothetical protein
MILHVFNMLMLEIACILDYSSTHKGLGSINFLKNIKYKWEILNY